MQGGEENGGEEESDLPESLSEDEEDEEREYSKREQEALACARKIKEYCAGLTVREAFWQIRFLFAAIFLPALHQQQFGYIINFAVLPAPYKILCGDIVILLRTMSGWAEVFAKVLTEQGIPAVSDTQGGYFNVPEIKWLLNYLRILDP